MFAKPLLIALVSLSVLIASPSWGRSKVVQPTQTEESETPDQYQLPLPPDNSGARHIPNFKSPSSTGGTSKKTGVQQSSSTGEDLGLTL